MPDSAVIEDVEGEDRGEESEAKVDSSDVFYSMNEGYEGNEAGVGQSPGQIKNQKKQKESDAQEYPEHVK